MVNYSTVYIYNRNFLWNIKQVMNKFSSKESIFLTERKKESIFYILGGYVSYSYLGIIYSIVTSDMRNAG